ncbi:hypothetical protein R50073_10690 [Maricurvus nonylphenolicus]|uniref:hypothetical protein n=1 Tax=Maricurvus nonylphenolicus TaxID=1008307 RepID=UPI0036F2B6FC
MAVTSVIASEASLFLTPQSIIFDEKSRSQAVHVVNRGNRTGVFAIRWIDHTMTEEGRLFTWKEPDKSPWSLQPYVRYSPRRVTLRPGESQLVRIALKKPYDQVPIGEYFSHLNVVMLNKNVEESIRQQEEGSEEAEAGVFRVVARTGISIPVLWRHTRDQPAAEVEISQWNSSQQTLSLQVKRLGQVSTRGFLHVIYQQNGKEKRLLDPHPLVIYPNIDGRKVNLSLANRALAGGKLYVYYSADKEHWDKPLGFASIQL